MMKVIVLFFMLLVSFASAKDEYKYDISLVGMNMDYREYDDNSQILDSEKSDFTQMMGVELGFSYLLNAVNDNYSQFDISVLLLSGQTDYVGAKIVVGKPTKYGSYKDNSNNYVMDSSIGYNYHYRLNLLYEFNIGLGVGYKYWRRELSVSQIEEYKWFSLRPNIGMTYNITHTLYIQPKLEYQYAIEPTMRATGFQNDFKLGSVNTFQASIPIFYRYNKNIEIFFKTILEYQKIKKSNVQYAYVYDINGNLVLAPLLEPDSEAKNQYIKFGVAFKY